MQQMAERLGCQVHEVAKVTHSKDDDTRVRIEFRRSKQALMLVEEQVSLAHLIKPHDRIALWKPIINHDNNDYEHGADTVVFQCPCDPLEGVSSEKGLTCMSRECQRMYFESIKEPCFGLSSLARVKCCNVLKAANGGVLLEYELCDSHCKVYYVQTGPFANAQAANVQPGQLVLFCNVQARTKSRKSPVLQFTLMSSDARVMPVPYDGWLASPDLYELRALSDLSEDCPSVVCRVVICDVQLKQITIHKACGQAVSDATHVGQGLCEACGCVVKTLIPSVTCMLDIDDGRQQLSVVGTTKVTKQLMSQRKHGVGTRWTMCVARVDQEVQVLAAKNASQTTSQNVHRLVNLLDGY